MKCCSYAYSLKPNPWEWLTSKDKAEAMAEKVNSIKPIINYQIFYC